MRVYLFILRHRRWAAGIALAAAGLAGFVAEAGRMLYVNAPQPAEVIVVLNGGTYARIRTGLQLLEQGAAPRLVLDVDAAALDWNVPALELARNWVARLPASEQNAVSICGIHALSTAAEVEAVQPCLGGARAVLLVTSAYHTRRALTIFRHGDAARHYSIAAAPEPAYFGTAWWRHRQWAKTTGEEWLKLLWWEGVDRWRQTAISNKQTAGGGCRRVAVAV